MLTPDTTGLVFSCSIAADKKQAVEDVVRDLKISGDALFYRLVLAKSHSVVYTIGCL